MTETSPTGTFTPVHGKRKANSCGIPLPQIEIRMLDLDDPTATCRSASAASSASAGRT